MTNLVLRQLSSMMIPMDRLDTTDEDSLLRQVSAGSREAFAQLIREHQAAVRWCLSRYLRDRAIVDDLAQEVFLRAYQALSVESTVTHLRSWLLGVARNLAREFIRTDSRRRNREQGPLAVQMAIWRAEREEARELDGEEYEHLLGTLQDCLARLSPENRQLIEEHYFQKQTLESIAKRTHRTGGSLRMLLLRIRTALMRCIQQKKGTSISN